MTVDPSDREIIVPTGTIGIVIVNEKGQIATETANEFLQIPEFKTLMNADHFELLIRGNRLFKGEHPIEARGEFFVVPGFLGVGKPDLITMWSQQLGKIEYIPLNAALKSGKFADE